MKKLHPKISFLNRDTVVSVERYVVFTRTKFFSFVGSIKMFVLSKLLRVDEASIFLVTTKQDTAFRTLFKTLQTKGLIKSFGEGPLFSDYPRLSMIGVSFFLDKEIDERVQMAWGYVALGDDSNSMYAKALGETLERNATHYISASKAQHYPSIFYGDASFLFPYIPKFTQEQIRCKSDVLAKDDDLKKVKGFNVNSLTGDKKRFFPIGCFYWGDTKEEKGKAMFHETSSGSGGGLTHTNAFLSATYELIERDHFLLYWLSGVNPDIIDIESIPGDFGEYVRQIREEYNLEIYFLDTTYDIQVQVCTCIVIDPVLHLVSIGAKAHSLSIEAMKSSLHEAFAVIFTTRERGTPVSEDELKEVLSKKTFLKTLDKVKRADLYCSNYGVTFIKNMFLSGDLISYDKYTKRETLFMNKEDERKHLLAEFYKLVVEKGPGYHLYEHQFSSKWTQELSYKVVHVFVPSFLKLHLLEMYATPVSERLFSFAKNKGKVMCGEKDINTAPHFFV